MTGRDRLAGRCAGFLLTSDDLDSLAGPHLVCRSNRRTVDSYRTVTDELGCHRPCTLVEMRRNEQVEPLSGVMFFNG